MKTNYDRQSLFSILMLGVIFSGFLARNSRAAGDPVSPAPQFSYNQYEVVIGSAERQTVLTGFLLGGAMAELAVIHMDKNGDRRLRILSFNDGAWEPSLDATLRPDVLFVDVAHIGGHDRLITYEPGRLNWFDPESATEHKLAAVSCSFDRPRKDEIPHVDVTRNLNGDDRDDLVVPDVDGFRILIQSSDGAFADPVTIGPATDMSGIYGADGYRHDPWSRSRVHAMDFDHDGRSDLVFWDKDHFKVHRQVEHGVFAPEAGTFKTEVTFDSDDPFSLATGDMAGRVLHSFTDLNGDAVADLVVVSLTGKGISRKRSAYEVHFGSPTTDGGTAFATDADFVFRSNDRLRLRKDRAYRSNHRIQLKMGRYDFNGDGNIDVMFTTIDPYFLKRSLLKSMKGFMGDDVLLGLEFYRMEDGRFSATPNAIRVTGLDGIPSHREPGSVPLEIALRGATHEMRKTQEIWPRAFNSILLIGDVTGDGLADLILGNHPRQLEVFVGVPESGLFSGRSQGVRIDVTNDEEYTWLVDLNRDGKQDILMHRPFILRDGHGAPRRAPGTEQQRVMILISQ